MKRTYTVHGIATVAMPVKVIVDGEELTAMRDRAVIELIPSADDGSGTVKLVTRPDEVVWAEGDTLEAEFGGAL